MLTTTESAPPSAPPSRRERLASLDAFRGLTIFLMVFVIAVAAAGYRDLPQAGSWFGSLPVSAWNHADVGWEQFVEQQKSFGRTDTEIALMPEAKLKNVGLTVTDLVAPFFVFIVGVAIPLARARRGAEWWRHVLVRTGTLILVGVLYISLILGLSWWWGILQAIGVAYFMGAASMKLSRNGRWITIAGLLVLHILLSHFVEWWLHFGETTEPFWTLSTPFGSWAKPLTVHCRPWVSISYGVMTMVGVLLGEAVAAGSRAIITRRALLLAAVFLPLGYAVHWAGLATGVTELCFNKPDVTASYAMFTSGLGALLFLLLYYCIDVWNYRAWAAPLSVFGVNALLAYFMQVMMRLGFRALHIEPFFAGAPNPQLQSWASLFQSSAWQLFLLEKTGYTGVVWGLIWTGCLWLIVRSCNARNIIWKL